MISHANVIIATAPIADSGEDIKWWFSDENATHLNKNKALGLVSEVNYVARGHLSASIE